MTITEIRVKLVGSNEERLRAFCSVTLEGCFVIRDLKVIDGASGPFVAMPSRKLSDRCPKCSGKNHLRAKFCNECGARLDPNRAPRDEEGRIKLHADVAHPINAAGREQIQREVIEAYERECEAAEEPGYESREVDFDDLREPGFDEFVAGISESMQMRRAGAGADAEAQSGSQRVTRPAQDKRHDRPGGRQKADANAVCGGRPIEPVERGANRRPPTDEDPFSAGIL
ncbi:MAG: septation protein SpoVG family protein [Planctomycetia bacterium]|nr:septation protein SpoVG family protein [Planctomycetia bacterium]